jgi:hypothetical protein
MASSHARSWGVEPSAQVSGAVALDQVDQDALVEIDQPGGVDRRMVPRGAQERGLIHTERVHLADPVRVLDKWPSVLVDRGHDRPPAHAQLVRELGHRPGVLAHLAARLHPGPAGQHRPRRDVLGGLGPRLRGTQRLPATPPALAPHQPRRSAEARQIPDLDVHPVLGLSAHPAARTALHPGDRLDLDHHLGRRLGHRQHPEPGESQQRLRQPGTVVHRRGLLVVAAVEQPQRWRDPCPAWWTPQLPPAPHFNA